MNYTVASLLKRLHTMPEQEQIKMRLQVEIDGIIDPNSPQIHYVNIHAMQTSLDFVRSFSLTEESRDFIKVMTTIIILCDSVERDNLRMQIKAA